MLCVDREKIPIFFYLISPTEPNTDDNIWAFKTIYGTISETNNLDADPVDQDDGALW